MKLIASYMDGGAPTIEFEYRWRWWSLTKSRIRCFATCAYTSGCINWNIRVKQVNVYDYPSIFAPQKWWPQLTKWMKEAGMNP